MTFRGFTQVLSPEEFGPPTGQVAIGAEESQGTAGVASEADHVHAVPAAAAGAGASTSLPGDAESDGVATTPARSDHVHAREQASDIAALPNGAPVLGTLYQNTLGVPVAIMVVVTVTPSTTAAATVSIGVAMTDTPSPEVVASVPEAAQETTVPVVLLVPAAGYWVIDASSPGAAGAVGTPQAVAL